MLGEKVSHYRIEDKLGGGGMGVVYRATDLKLGRVVALKFLPPELSNDAERKERFIIEAKAASVLDHPNIGTIYEVDETKDGRLFIAMAYYKGETLKKKILCGPIPLDEAVNITRQIARGLEKVHAEDIVHRDIKPANVILTEDDLAKILDFGLAKLVTMTSITGSGAAMGTPAYMSPEQTRGSDVDARTDLWSLGVLLFEMVTGELPFKGGHPQAVILAILNNEPPWEELRRKAPSLEPVVRRALEKDPVKRYQSAGELLADLESPGGVDLSDSDVTQVRGAANTLASPRKKRKLGLFAAGLFGLVLAVFLFAWGASERRMREAIESLTPEIEAGNLDAVHETLLIAGVDLNSSRLDDLAPSFAGRLVVTTEPRGVSVEAYRGELREDFVPSDALLLGTTPLPSRRLVAGEYLLQLTGPGLASAELLVELDVGEELTIERKLIASDDVPEGMVFVVEGTASILGNMDGGVTVPSFFIDRTEVTNAQFLEFVAAGGYRNADLWPEPLIVDGEPISWTEAMSRFVDRTSIPGPRRWSGGTYPESRADHPVVGVSWYEASAYAKWREKELPSWDQWWRAALGARGEVFPWGMDVRYIDLRSNFGLVGTRPVGSYPLGISPFGGHDFAGNVREWLRAPSSEGKRRVVGGSWLDPSYMFEPTHAESFDPAYANEAIGFRCTKPGEE
ncbi:MAG: hypothetical protein BMS9Abin37_0749 [Acidobacteriota bacterium]|nr:MAG: hypothetical protein BMS9Abin37_0749 [Acidobacteriota bacterium]